MEPMVVTFPPENNKRTIFFFGTIAYHLELLTFQSLTWHPKLFYSPNLLDWTVWTVSPKQRHLTPGFGQQNKDMDVESLQRTGRRRGSCLEVFLVLSVMFLFAALTVVAVGGAIVVNELRAKLESPRPSPTQFEELIEAAKRTTFKMQNFVYLEANESKVQTYTMPLTPVSYGTGNSVGSNFLFDKSQKWLQAMRKGTYFTYIDLNVTCTEGDSCPTGLLSVSLGQKLICEVALPANKTRVSKKCWTVTQLEKQKLLTQMTVTGAGLDTWKLEQSGSGVGMFLVD